MIFTKYNEAGILVDAKTGAVITDSELALNVSSVLVSNISMMDSKMQSGGVSARQKYIDDLAKPPKSESVLIKEYFERNHKASLAGFAPYTTPENGGVES